MELLGVPVRWLGHSGFYFDTDPSIVVDPFRARDPRPVDLALVTHPHFDHLSVDDLDGFVGPQTTIVSVPDARPEVEDNWPDHDLVVVEPGETATVQGVAVEATPAFNVNKTYHPPDRDWVGFVFEVDGVRFYHAGDSDRLPAMADVDADVAFLPVSGTYVMDVDDAVAAADDVDAERVVPMHYGTTVGTRRDAERFAKAVGETAVVPEED